MKSKLIYIIAAVVAVVVLAVSGGIYWYTSNNYVAKVGGEKITKAEFSIFLSQAKAEMESEAKDENEKKALWESKIEGKDAKEVAKENALKYAKDLKISLIQAKEKKIALDKTELDRINSEVDRMITQEGGRAALENKIKELYGVNFDEYVAFYKDYMLFTKFMSEAPKGIQVNDEDVRKYYTEKMETAESTTVRHILLQTKDPSGNVLPADKQEEVKKKADEVLSKAKAGGDFGALAKEFSEDPGSKDTKGQYTFGKGEMVKEFEDWSFKAKPGDIGMVKSDFGYHIMKKPTFEEMNKDDYENLKKGAQQNKLVKELDTLKNDPKYDVVKNQRVFDSIKVA